MLLLISGTAQASHLQEIAQKKTHSEFVQYFEEHCDEVAQDTLRVEFLMRFEKNDTSEENWRILMLHVLDAIKGSEDADMIVEKTSKVLRLALEHTRGSIEFTLGNDDVLQEDTAIVGLNESEEVSCI